MAKIFFTGNALSRNQIVTLTDPDQDGYVYITINGYQLFFETWDAEVIAAGINASTEDALDGLTASVNEEGRVLIEGGESIEFVVTMSVQAAVDITVLTEGRPKKPQITTFSLPSTVSGGTWTITVNGQATSALSYAITAANLKAAIEALSSVGSGDATVNKLSSTSWQVMFGGSLLGAVVSVSGSGSGLTGQAVALVETIQKAGANGRAIYLIASPEMGQHKKHNAAIQLVINGVVCCVTAGVLGQHIPWGNKTSSQQPGFPDLATMTSQISAALGTTDFELFEASGQALSGFDWRVLTFVAKGSLLTGGLPVVELRYPGATPSSFTITPINNPLAGQTDEVILMSIETGYLGLPGTAGDIAHDGTTHTIATPLNIGTVMTALGFSGAQYDIHWLCRADGHSYYLDGSPVAIPGSYVFAFRFKGSSAQTDLPVFTFTNADSNCQVLADGTVPVNEIQQIAVLDGSGGSFKAAFGGQVAGATIAFPTAAATFKTHLETLSNIDAGDVVVTGGTGASDSPLFVEFKQQYETTDVPLISLDVSAVTGGTVSLSNTQTSDAGASEVQLVSIRDEPIGGDYRLLLGETQSAAIAYNESDSGLEDILEAMSNIGAGNVSVEAAGARSYKVSFISAKAFTAIPLFEVVQNTLLLGDTDTLVAYTQEATGPGHWRDPKNWSLSRVPECGDDILLEDIPRDSDIRYGLIQLVDFTVNTTTDVCSCVEHDFVAGQKVRLASTSELPSPLAVDTDYFVVAPNRYVGTFQLSATLGGSVINITSVGTGIHSCGVRANSLTHYMSCQAQIGLPRRRDNGNGVREILNRYLRIGLMGEQKILLGRGEGNGSGLIRIDHGRDKANIVALDSAGPAERDAPTINIVGTSDLTELQVSNGASVGYCCFPDESGGLAFIQGLGGEIIAGDVTLHAAMEIRQSSGAQIRCPRLKTASNQVIISIM